MRFNCFLKGGSMSRRNSGILLFVLFIFSSMTGVCETNRTFVRTDTSEARQYMNRGRLLLNEAQYDSALHAFKCAKHVYQKTLESLDLWDLYIESMTYIGKAYLRQMQLGPASETLSEALDLANDKLEENHFGFALIYNELATLAFRKSDLERALEFDKKSLDIKMHHHGRIHESVASGFYNIGLTYEDLGDYDRALYCFLQSRDILMALRKTDSPAIASAYYGIGNIYIKKGHFDMAFEPLQKALALRRKHFSEKHPLIAETYHAIGFYYKETSDLDQAIEYFKKSVSIYSDCLGPDHPSVAYGNNNIGTAYWDKGDSEEALRYFNKSLEGKIKIFGEKHPSVANTYGNMGRIYLKLEAYREAFQYIRKSLDIRLEILGDQHPSVVLDYQYLGIAYQKLSDTHKALRNFEKALSLQLSNSGENHPTVANIYNEIGTLFMKTEAYEKALQSFQKSLMALVPAFEPSDPYQNPPLEGSLSDQFMLEALHLKAKTIRELYLTRSGTAEDLKASLNTSILALDLIDQMRISYRAEGSRLFLGEKAAVVYEYAIETALILADVTGDSAYQRMAFGFAEKSKFSTLALYIQELRARQFAGIPDDMLHQEKTLKTDLVYYNTELQRELEKKSSGDAARIKACQDTIFTLNQACRTLIRTFETNYPEYFALKYKTQTIPVNELQKQLNDSTLLIEYFVGENMLTVFTLSNRHMDVVTSDCDSSLARRVRSLNRAISKMETNKFLELSRTLYQQLIEPVRPHVAGNSKLIIIPHGILYRLPFEVLLTETPISARPVDFTKQAYLVRSHEIAYHCSATLFADTYTRKTVSAACSFAGFAPVFSDSATRIAATNSRPDRSLSEPDERSVRVSGKTYPALKYSQKEVREIIQRFERTGLTATGYFREDASEQNFKMIGGQCRYLHIASHGIVNETNPWLTGILFSQPSESNPAEDGILYSGELYNLSLNAELVVLSSCESGVGKLVKGEGLMALTRGFLYAGADNLLVSLWKVSDKHTSDLMGDFYQYVLNGDGFSTALRKAKLELIGRPGTAFPKSWGGFVLLGE